jgi:methyl-accepting chemotaxis protein
MSEISTASQEQSSGIEEVNRAVAKMDEMTQHNAALVEQAASAASTMQERAATLGDAVSVFELAATEPRLVSDAAPIPAAMSAPKVTRLPQDRRKLLQH